jgi:hypothetical protein
LEFCVVDGEVCDVGELGDLECSFDNGLGG